MLGLKFLQALKLLLALRVLLLQNRQTVALLPHLRRRCAELSRQLGLLAGGFGLQLGNARSSLGDCQGRVVPLLVKFGLETIAFRLGCCNGFLESRNFPREFFG